MPSLYFRQLKLGPMDNFVYLLGAEGAEEVAVVDAAWDVSAILQTAQADGKRIVAAFASHCHGDHINGLPDLLQKNDIPVYVQAEELAFSRELRRLGDCVKAVSPGQDVPVGPLTVKSLHTPGHTPGSQCLLSEGSLVSGDTLFVNACGRCDLPGGDPDAMYRSLATVLGNLPNDTRLLPGHDYGDLPTSTLAREKKQNPYFQFHALGEFVSYRMRPRG